MINFEETISFCNQGIEFSNLPRELREHIFELGELRSVRNLQSLVEIGECCNEIFLVLEGAFVCQYFEEELAIERTVDFHTDTFHSFMTVVGSYFYNTKSMYRIKAVRSSKVLVFKKHVVNELLANNPILNQFCMSGITSALISEITMKSKLIALPADKLYAYLITNYPQIIQQIPSKYIAEFIGITQEWLCKLKKKISFYN
jgi:CRP-like cAMP-binding protein